MNRTITIYYRRNALDNTPSSDTYILQEGYYPGLANDVAFKFIDQKGVEYCYNWSNVIFYKIENL